MESPNASIIMGVMEKKKKRQVLVKFGKKVRKERHKRGLSQEKLAELAGCHWTYIGMIERAERNITLANIERIAKALDMEIRDLFDC